MHYRQVALLAIAMALSSTVVVEAGNNSWTAAGPPEITRYYEFRIDPSDDNTLYVAAFGYPGLWRSRDRGRTWELLGQGTPLQKGLVTAIAIDRTDPKHLIAISISYFFESVDRGDSWTSITLPQEAFGGEEMAASADLSTIYVGSSQNCIGLFGSGCTGGGVAKSTDRGRTWTRTALKDRTIGLLEVDPVDARIAYATAIDYNTAKGSNVGLLFRTRDGGRNWSPVGPSVTVATSLQTSAGSHLLIDPAMPSNLFLSCDTGLWTSADGGDRWTNTYSTAPFTQIGAFAADPLEPGVVFAVTPAAIRSDPPPCPPSPPAPLPPAPCPPVVPPPPSPQNSLFGVIRSADHGQTWTRFIEPAVPGGSGFYLAVDSRRNTFYQLRSDGLFAFTPVSPHRRAVRP